MCFHQISQISICEQFDTDAIPTLATLALAAGSCNGYRYHVIARLYVLSGYCWVLIMAGPFVNDLG